MPTLSPETLRAYVYLNGKDCPANELSYYSELIAPDGTTCDDDFTEPEFIRFHIVRRHPDGGDEEVGYCAYAFGNHSRGHWEREFIDSTAKYVAEEYAAEKAKFEKLRDMMSAAGYPV
jgi:hypothetical protein